MVPPVAAAEGLGLGENATARERLNGRRGREVRSDCFGRSRRCEGILSSTPCCSESFFLCFYRGRGVVSSTPCGTEVTCLSVFWWHRHTTVRYPVKPGAALLHNRYLFGDRRPLCRRVYSTTYLAGTQSNCALPRHALPPPVADSTRHRASHKIETKHSKGVFCRVYTHSGVPEYQTFFR